MASSLNIYARSLTTPVRDRTALSLAIILGAHDVRLRHPEGVHPPGFPFVSFRLLFYQYLLMFIEGGPTLSDYQTTIPGRSPPSFSSRFRLLSLFSGCTPSDFSILKRSRTSVREFGLTPVNNSFYIFVGKRLRSFRTFGSNNPAHPLRLR